MGRAETTKDLAVLDRRIGRVETAWIKSQDKATAL